MPDARSPAGEAGRAAWSANPFSHYVAKRSAWVACDPVPSGGAPLW